MTNDDEMRDLVEKYPNLFKLFFSGREGDGPFWGCQSWGFECGSGWKKPLEKCAARLEAEILKQPDEEKAYAVQVKEKFGGLRFYLHGNETDEMSKIIAEAEEECSATCEKCGAPGSHRSQFWMRTHCDSCNEEYLKERS
jgi:hypothetical protein